jgi:hypothetical protein
MAGDEREAAEIFATVAEGLGLRATSERSAPHGPDVVMLDVGDRRVRVTITRFSTPTLAHMSRLLAREGARAERDALPVLVADRIPDAVRSELRRHGWGWLDLRGHLHLAGQGIFIDADVPTVNKDAGRADAFSGNVGLEVACALLLHPGVSYGVRELARQIDRSPSTVSEVLHALRTQRLVSPDGIAVVPGLFWETASAWKPKVTWLMNAPQPGAGSVNAVLELGLDKIESHPGWALTGTLAAVVYGASVAARSDYPPDFYVPSSAVARRASRLLGTTTEAELRGASIAVAPVADVCEQRVDPTSSYAKPRAFTSDSWPLVNPLFVALDLARDPGRGREILDGWQPPQPWQRVW